MKKPSLIRTILLAVSLVLQLTTLSILSHGAPGDVDLSFDPGSGVDRSVFALAEQADGKIIAGGEFTMVKGLPRRGLARLNADGSGDSTFDPGTILGNGGSVGGIVLQPDGKVLVSGYFWTTNGAARNAIARLHADGSLDTTFNPGVEPYSTVHAMVIQPDGKIIICGYFSRSDGTSPPGVARLNTNGTVDSSFTAPNFDGRLNALALQPDGRVVIGGGFTRVGGTSRMGIARLNANGSLNGNFNPGSGATGGEVWTVALDNDGRVLIGGTFTAVNGTARTGLARLSTSGALDSAFNPVIGGDNAYVSRILPQADNTVLIQGRFSTVQGASRNRIARLLAGGSLDESFVSNPGVNADLHTLIVLADGKVMLGGGFDQVDGVRRSRLARLHAGGSLDDTFDPGRGGIGDPSPNGPSTVRCLVEQADGKVIIGGLMDRNPIARLNADGSGDASFDPGSGVNGVVSTVLLQPDGRMLILGNFTTINGVNRFNVARLNSNGTLDTSFVPALQPEEHGNGFHHMVLLADGKVILGGYFSVLYFDFFGEPYLDTHSRCIRINADGTMDPGFAERIGEQGSAIISMALQPDGKVLLGDNPPSWGGVGLVRLHSNGTADPSFNPPLESDAFAPAIAVQPDGKVIAAVRVHGLRSPRTEVIRFNDTGTVDSSFSGALIEYSQWGAAIVGSVTLQPDGKVLILGQFTTVNGINRKGIARLNANGTLDNSFNPEPDGNVHAIALQSGGNLYIGGDFNTVNGVMRPRVARLLGDPLPPNPFASWAASFGLSGTAAAADADPDHDGLTSGIEFVLSGNPTLPAPSSLPALTTSGDVTVFTFSRADAAESPDVTLTVESGTDLVSWPNVFTIGPDTAASSPGVTILENGTAPDTITVAIPAGSVSARFARLKAAIAP